MKTPASARKRLRLDALDKAMASGDPSATLQASHPNSDAASPPKPKKLRRDTSASAGKPRADLPPAYAVLPQDLPTGPIVDALGEKGGVAPSVAAIVERMMARGGRGQAGMVQSKVEEVGERVLTLMNPRTEMMGGAKARAKRRCDERGRGRSEGKRRGMEIGKDQGPLRGRLGKVWAGNGAEKWQKKTGKGCGPVRGCGAVRVKVLGRREGPSRGRARPYGMDRKGIGWEDMTYGQLVEENRQWMGQFGQAIESNRCVEEVLLDGELQGAHIAVVQCRNARLAAAHGILFKEERDMLWLRERSGRARGVPKSGSVFRIRLDGWRVATVVGSSMRKRPAKVASM